MKHSVGGGVKLSVKMEIEREQKRDYLHLAFDRPAV